jgi:polysaccharide biosynthesis transport protein
MSDEATGDLDLRGYLRVVRRRKWIIMAATVLVAATALGVSLIQTPVYEGRAELLLQARSSETLFNPNTGARVDPARALDTEIQVLKSRPVRDLVEDRIGNAPEVTASGVGQTDVFVVKAESTDPERAAAIANAYADAYIDFRRTQQVNDLLQAAAQIQQKIDQLQGQIEALETTDTTLRPGASAATDQNIAQRNSLLQQQAVFLQKLDQLQVDAALKSGGAQLVTPAIAPIDPIRPTPERNTVLGLVVGLMLGVGLAFLFEFLDTTLKGKEDVERAVPGLPIVGLIPALPNWKDERSTVVVSVSEPKSPAAEAYRSVRTSIQFMGLDKRIRVIQVTSPGQAEGKSTTISNLAVALANAGQRVVVVDADLRRPRLHHFFGCDNAVGLTSVLVGDVDLPSALQPATDVKRVHVLASGPIPPNPSELLATARMGQLLDTLSDHADIVLVDCPPVLPVTDATVLAPKVDATVLVVRASKTHQGQLRRAVEVLAHVQAPLMGIVVNGISGEEGYGYAYGYGYRYVPSDGGRGRDVPAAAGNGSRSARGEAPAPMWPEPEAPVAPPAPGPSAVEEPPEASSPRDDEDAPPWREADDAQAREARWS